MQDDHTGNYFLLLNVSVYTTTLNCMKLFSKYCKFPNKHPHCLHTTLTQKWGGVHLLEYSILVVHTPLPLFLAILNMYKVDNHDDCCGCILWEISSSCVDTKPRDIKASCIISDDGRLHISTSNSNISGSQ